MSASTDTLRKLRADQLFHRNRIEAFLERQSAMSDRIDVLAAQVAHLPDVKLTVRQSARLEVIGRELLRRAGVTS